MYINLFNDFFNLSNEQYFICYNGHWKTIILQCGPGGDVDSCTETLICSWKEDETRKEFQLNLPPSLSLVRALSFFFFLSISMIPSKTMCYKSPLNLYASSSWNSHSPSLFRKSCWFCFCFWELMAIEEDIESCGSRAFVQSSQAHPRQHRKKLEVYNEVLRRIQESNCEEANVPGFDDQLWLHFNRLPARYMVFQFNPTFFFVLHF